MALERLSPAELREAQAEARRMSEIGLALDCGPGFTVPDAIRLAKAMEPYNLMWLEDMMRPDNAAALARLRSSTSTPITSQA